MKGAADVDLDLVDDVIGECDLLLLVLHLFLEFFLVDFADLLTHLEDIGGLKGHCLFNDLVQDSLAT